MTEPTIEARTVAFLKAHPRLAGVLLAAMAAASQAGMVAPDCGHVTSH